MELLDNQILINASLKEEIKTLQDGLEYSKNKENKLMYLIFKLHKKGYPVNDVYESEVKPISTRRFNNEMMETE